MNPAKKKSAGVPDAISLIEQSVHLLRAAPPSTLVIYYATAVPFVLGLLFFWAQVTWFAPPPAAIAWFSLGLTLLFAAMKMGQSEFCARLLAQRLGARSPNWNWGKLWRVGASQLRVHAWGLFLVPMAAVLGAPFGWIYAFFQNATVLGDERDLLKNSGQQAILWPMQNHLGLLFLSVLAICAAINLGAAFWLLPWLANRLLGIENIFGFTGWWFANTTFLASVVALAWLVTDPLVKAFYTLRVFHGRSLTNGDDLKVELEAARQSRQLLRVAAAALIIIALLSTSLPMRAVATKGPETRTISATELDHVIDSVLEGQDFQWRLRPPPTEESDEALDGPFKHFVRQGVKYLGDFGRWMVSLRKRAADWVMDLFPSRHDSSAATNASSSAPAVLKWLLYLFLAAAVLLIIGLIVLVIRRSRIPQGTTLTARAVTTAVPDLRDENTQATQLPVEGWLVLAREQLALREWRLAIRALQLAALARLASEGLIALGQAKTNLDYERELKRRAFSRRELVTRFSQRRRVFEAVWYGRAEAVEAEARDWLAELERPLT